MVSILQLFYCFWLFRTSLLLLIKACGMHVVAWLTPRHWWARCGSDTVGSELGHLTQQSFISVCLLHSPSETGKNLPAVLECWTRSLAWEDPLEEGMATHCSIPAWRTPQTEEPGKLQSIGSQRVRQDWSNLAHMHKHSHHGSFQFTNIPSTTLQNHWTGYLGILASSILKQLWSFCPLN